MTIHTGQVKKEQYDRLRLGVGLTDYSHYQIFEISGPSAAAAVNGMVLSDIMRLPIGRAAATYMLRDDARLLADVLIWNQGGRYLMLAEATDTDSLEPWITAHASTAVIKNLGVDVSLVGIDGPFAWELLKEAVGVRILGLRYLETMADQKILGLPVDIIRAGKTGEYGYILKCKRSDGEELREKLLQAGQGLYLAPCEAAALQLCQLENRFTNVLKEGTRAKTVLELNCRIQVSDEKGDYVGRGVIKKTMQQGSERRLIGLTSDGLATPPEGSPVCYRGEPIGEFVAAGFSWSIGKPIGLALLSSAYAYVGCNYDVNGSFQATTVSAPFVLNKSIQIRPQEDSFRTVDWSFKL